MKKLFLLMVILMLSPYVCHGAINDLEMIAEKYNNLIDKPVSINIKPELCSVRYDLKKNIVEIKLSSSFYQSQPCFLLSNKIEKYEPTLIFDPDSWRLAMSYKL